MPQVRVGAGGPELVERLVRHGPRRRGLERATRGSAPPIRGQDRHLADALAGTPESHEPLAGLAHVVNADLPASDDVHLEAGVPLLAQVSAAWILSEAGDGADGSARGLAEVAEQHA